MKAKTIPTYAAATKVSPDKTEMEIKKLLQSYGATGIIIGEKHTLRMIAFELDSLQIRYQFDIPLEVDFAKNSIGKARGDAERRAVYEQAVRTIWRMMLHRIKDRLIVAFSPFSSVYEEFFRDIVLSDGSTMGERYPESDYRQMVAERKLPPLLPGGKD